MLCLRRKLQALRQLIVLTLCGIVFAASAAEQKYVVKSRDTLYGIARKFGVSPGELAARNNLSRNSQVYVGQNLVVPVKDAPSAPSTPSRTETSAASSTVQRSIERAPVASGRWRYIVIHHSGADEGSLKAIDRYHREERHMEHGMAYHFLIGNGNGMGDGEIAVGNRWKDQRDGGHLRSEDQNKVALGICLIGNFDKKKPTERQLRSLEPLIRSLMKRCNLSANSVKTHQQINIVRTECPGDKFPTRSFLNQLKKPAK